MSHRKPSPTQREQEASPTFSRPASGGVSGYFEAGEIQPSHRREPTDPDTQPRIRPLMTQQEAAKVLRISTRQVQIEIAKGRLRAVRIGRRTLLNRDDLQEFIQVRSSYVGTREQIGL